MPLASELATGTANVNLDAPVIARIRSSWMYCLSIVGLPRRIPRQRKNILFLISCVAWKQWRMNNDYVPPRRRFRGE